MTRLRFESLEKRIAWLFVLAIAALPAGLQAQLRVVDDLATARKKASEEGKFIVLDVSADWCPPCQKMAREVYPDPDFIAFSKTQVFMIVDAYKQDQGIRLSRKFEVKVFPTILVLDAQGKEIDRITGGRTTSGLIEDLTAIFEFPLPAKELNKRADSQPQDLELQFKAGRRALDRDDFKAAQRLLARAAESDSEEIRSQALLFHSEASFEAGDYQESLRSLDAVVQMSPSMAEVPFLQLRRARSLIALKRHDQALPVLDALVKSAAADDRKRARELFDRLPKQYRKADEKAAKLAEKAAKKLEKNQPQEALEMARQAVEMSPTPEARMTLAMAHLKIAVSLGQGSQARPHYEQGLYQLRLCRLSDPFNMTTYTQARSLLASSLVRYEPASKEAAKLFSKAEEHFAAERLRPAAEKYLEVTQLDPGFAKAYLHLGDCFFANNQFDQALSLYLEAARKAPLDASTYRFAASALGKLERAEEARSMLLAGLLADPEYPMTWIDIRSWAQQDRRGFEIHGDVIPHHLLTVQPQDDYEGLFDDLPARTVPAWREYVNRKLYWRQERFAQEFPKAPYYTWTAREEVDCLQALAEQWDAMRSGDAGLGDEDLDFIRQLALDERLEAFVLLELYTEEFRSELEKWKAGKEDLVRAYLRDYVFASAQSQASAGFNTSAIRDLNAGVEFHRSDPARAAALYRKALRQEPRMPNAAGNLAQTLFNLEKFAEAEPVAKLWAELKPDSPRPFDLLSLILERQDRFSEAVEAVEKAIALETDLASKERLQRNLEIFKSRLK